MNAKQFIAGAAMFAASAAVFAQSSEYTSPDEGFISTKTRAEVIAALQQAQADGSYQTASAEYQDPVSLLARNTGAPAGPVAVSSTQIAKSAVLKDGSIVYVFKDGKMGMENRFGKVIRMNEGHVMQAQDGATIIMIGDEVARLDSILHAEYPGN